MYYLKYIWKFERKTIQKIQKKKLIEILKIQIKKYWNQISSNSICKIKKIYNLNKKN